MPMTETKPRPPTESEHTDVKMSGGLNRDVIHCAICGPLALSSLYYTASSNRIPQSYRITEEEHSSCWDIRRCDTCGLIFSDWRLTVDQLSRLYASMQDEVYDREDLCRRLTFRRGLKLIEKKVIPGDAKGLLLDVGCATGLFLVEAQDRGWQVSGVDLSSWAVERAKQRGVPTVHEGTVYTLTVHGGHCDVVTMLDYIEHDPDVDRLVERVSGFLKPGGLFYITTPNIGSFVAQFLGKHWWGINPLHLTYFSRKTLRKLLEKHGFEVIVSRSYTRIFTVGYWASRMSHFHHALGPILSKIVRTLGIANLKMYLNLGDQMEIVARKQYVRYPASHAAR